MKNQSFEDYHREDTVRHGSDRAFGLVFSLFFAAIGMWPLVGGGSLRVWALLISCAFFATALIRPAALGKANQAWTRFGLFLHRVVSPVLLGLIFYGVITPLAVVMRLLEKDPLRLRFEPELGTYWQQRPAHQDKQAMRKQF